MFKVILLLMLMIIGNIKNNRKQTYTYKHTLPKPSKAILNFNELDCIELENHENQPAKLNQTIHIHTHIKYNLTFAL